MSADDPVADFLAREQDDLAGLEDSVAATDLNADAAAPAAETPAFGDDEPVEEEEYSEEQAQMNAENDLAAALGGAVEDAASLAISAPPANMYDSLQPQRPTEEPEKIRKWREDQKARLEKKDKDEKQKIADWKAAAKKELDDWYKSRAEQLQNAAKNNRNAETQFIAERDAVTPGKDWERVARLCEFNPKTAKNTKDVSRMRSLLLQMKQGETESKA